MRGLWRRPPHPQQRPRRSRWADFGIPTDAYTTAITGTSGLVGYWKLGEASGYALDYSGQGRHGEVIGGVTRDVPGAIVQDDGSATFNGTTGYVRIPHSANFQIATTGQLSIEFWAKTLASSGNFVAKTDGVDNYEYRLQSNSGVFVNVYNGGVNDAAQADSTAVGAAGTTVNDDAWHHVVVTFNEATDTIVIYVDGGVEVTDTDTWTRPSNEVASDAPLLFAQRGDGEFLAGTLDEVAVYNVVLDAATVVAHYNLGVGIVAESVGYPYIGGGYYPNAA